MMKTGKNKRLLASILAASMLLAMSPFALALADETEQKEMTTQEQVQSAPQNETNANPTVSQTDGQSSGDTNSEAPKTEGQPSEGTGTTETKKPEASKSAAKIGEKEYASIADAMAAAKPGDTIKLLKDITESVEVKVAKDVGGELTIDLNKYSIDGNSQKCIWRTGSSNCWPSKLIVKNGTLKNAGSGSAIEWRGDLEVVNCRFEKNQGGAIQSGRDNLSGRGNTTIVNSTFEKNQSGNAAGAAVQLTQNVGCTITDSDFLGNATNTNRMGGAVYVDHGTLDITDCTFERNSAGFGGAIAVADGVKLTIGNNTDCLDNNASYGGGIYANGANINIAANSVLCNNIASGYGGGIYASASNINIAANSAVYNNTAATAGDDLFFFSKSTFTLPNAKDMSGDRILSSDKTEITGWYHDGYKWNAAANNGQGGFKDIGRWTAETADEYVLAENDSHAVSLKAATKKSSGGTESGGGGTDPIKWDVSRSKTATKLDTNTWTSNVTLSLPSAEEKLASDVVFVLDKSTSAEKEEQALGMLTALKEQTAKTGAKVKVGVVIFNKQANVTAPLTDLATGSETIEDAIKQEIKSGTNTHAGMLAGKQLLD